MSASETTIENPSRHMFLRLVFLVWVATLAFGLPEVFAGTGRLWLFRPTVYVLALPLYVLHFLLLAHIAVRTRRTSWSALYLFGVAFSGFALFWMIMAASAGGGFWMFGLIHFFVGIGIGIGPIFWSTYRRRNTWYTLTNKRALIATDLPMRGRKLKSYPITKETPLEFSTGDPASITFATERRRRKNGSYEVKIGFERIKDGEQVYTLLRDIQKEAV